ncbi:MAG: hydantoinase B/oxoprolinase family protein [Thermoplasmata archaeon]
MSKKVDPVTVEVIRNALGNVCDTMKVTVESTAYSTVISETVDYSNAIIGRDGELIAETAGLPVFLATLSEAVRETDRVIGFDNLEEGDIIFCNDPYSGGFSHNPDITVMKPVYIDGKLETFSCFRGHTLDMGSRTPGGWLNNTENCYQDGVCFPPVKLYRGGEKNQDIFRLIHRSTRYPDAVLGDIRAMVSAVRVGDDRVSKLYDHYGVEMMRNAINQMRNNAEEVAREAVRDLPDGEYEGEYFADGDGDDDNQITDKIRVKMKMIIKNDEIHVDFEGSSPQTNGPMNCPAVTTKSLARLGFKALTTPDKPNNAGHFRPLSVSIPERTVLNPEPPASTALNWIHVGGIPDLMQKVLEDVIPKKVTGSHFGTPCASFVYGKDPRDNSNYMFIEGDAGGWGATPERDGESALFCKELGDTNNTPIEVVETKYPIEVSEYSLIKDSGGPGKYRGGLGVKRDFTPMNHDARVTATFDRQKYSPPWGVCGGKAGATNHILFFKEDGNKKRYGKITDVPLKETELVSFRGGGGGGYGNPFERKPENVLQDVIDDYISIEHAKQEYGVVITDDLEIDWGKTEDIRNKGE